MLEFTKSNVGYLHFVCRPKFYITVLLGIKVVAREIEDNYHAKFFSRSGVGRRWGTNKVH